jgi:hypothetical protein
VQGADEEVRILPGDLLVTRFDRSVLWNDALPFQHPVILLGTVLMALSSPMVELFGPRVYVASQCGLGWIYTDGVERIDA